MNNLEQQHFSDFGFVVQSNRIDPERVRTAHQLIQSNFPIPFPTSKETASSWMNIKSRLRTDPIILSLIEPLISQIEQKCGPIHPIHSCQIGSRFPGEGLEPSSWHLDNFTDRDVARAIRPREFDLMLGIYLSDNLEGNQGNFTCYPGAHHQIRAYLAQHGCRSPEDAIARLSEHLPVDKISVPDSFQVRASAGSVLWVDRALPHLISGPNSSVDYVRTIIWFRIYPMKLNHTLILHRATPSSLPIELDGRGYQVSDSGEVQVYRVKPNWTKHIPNFFGSMVEVTFDSRGCQSIHTGGFLSKLGHQRWLKQLQSHRDIFSIICIINSTDYEYLIEQLFPLEEEEAELVRTESCSILRLVQIELTFHHLHSEAKSAMIRRWCHQLDITADITRGVPGKIIVVGIESRVNLVMERIRGLYFNRTPIIVRCKLN